MMFAAPFPGVSTLVEVIAAALVGAGVVLTLFLTVRRFRARLAKLTGERDAKERLLEEMRKLEKFRREFVSNVTHEIRTPLTGITGAVDVLSEDESLTPEDRTAMFNVLKEQTVRLDKLAQDILSLARIEHSEERGRRDFVVCDLSDVMKNVFTLMSIMLHHFRILNTSKKHYLKISTRTFKSVYTL